MQDAISTSQPGAEPEGDIAAFYRHVLDTLHTHAVPFLIGGAYALHQYTGIARHTRDLDIFIRRQDYASADTALCEAGYRTELTFPHWLGKIHCNGLYIDLIFSSGNGVAEVDGTWFEHAGEAEVLGISTKICPAEEIIWSKAFIMERERFDGADVVHLLRACGNQLDWPRLFRRFEPHWRILLCHLILFGFVYPAQRDLVPAYCAATARLLPGHAAVARTVLERHRQTRFAGCPRYPVRQYERARHRDLDTGNTA